jgi:hypothetical protein
MSEQITDEYVPNDLLPTVEHANAIPVRVVREPGEKSSAPEFSSLQSYVLTGTEQPFPILAFSRKRKNATITVQPNQAILAVNTFQFVASTVVNANGQVGNVWDTAILGDDIQGIEVQVNVTATGGVTPTVVFNLQDSPDGVNWATVSSSAAVTGTGVTRIASQQPLARFVRVSASQLGGTTPTFTVAPATGTATTGMPVSSQQQSVIFAKQEQVSNGKGAIVLAPGQFQYSAQPNVICIPQATNGAVILTVVEEWYA